MSSPAHLLRRIRSKRHRLEENLGKSLERRWQNARPGSVLILVVALLVLLALMGTAYISSARTDRSSSTQNTFNTEIDLLVQGVCNVVQQQILSGSGGPNDPTSPATQASPMLWTSLSDSPWLASRLPSTDNGNVNGNVIWPQITAPAIGSKFESPVNPNNDYGSTANNTNVRPTFTTIQTPSGPQNYPALMMGGTTYLAASASGSGIADSGLVRLPIGELNGITYYYAAFTIDNGSAVNASIAYKPNDANAALPGDFSPACLDLAGMLRAGTGASSASVTDQLTALNLYRCGNTTQANPSAAIYDMVNSSGTSTTSTPVTLGFNFNSPQEALWMQLGRRLDNPGYNTANSFYQALTAGDAMSLAHRYCLMNAAVSSSNVELALTPSLTTTDSGGTTPVRSTPYGPDQAQLFYSGNFDYDNGGNLRPLLVTRNQTSSVSPSLFNNKGTWDSTRIYSFGDWVTDSSGASFVALQDNVPTGVATAPLASPQYWAKEPWVDYPVKTEVNTATFGQLWLGYWGVMSSKGADTPETAAANLYRNPIRGSVSVSGSSTSGNGSGTSSGTGTIWHVTPTGGNDTSNIQSIIGKSSPGDTIAFAAGTYSIGSTINFLPNRIYSGGGTPAVSGIAALTVPQTLRLRAALAAINTMQLRGDNTSILSQQIGLGNVSAVDTTPGTNVGGATLAWANGDPGNGPELGTFYGGTTTEFTGFTVTGCQLHFEGGTFNVHGNTFQNTYRGIYCAQNSGHYDNNTFTHTDQEGIWAYAGSNATYSNNTTSNTGNDGIHLYPTSSVSNITVANNVVTGTRRIGIEIQNVITNLAVTGNYVSINQPAASGSSWMGLSIATGNGNNIAISGNTIVSDQVKGAAVEIMGTNASITNNTSWGYGLFILNGAQGSQLTANGNKIYGGSYSGNDFVPWAIAPINSPEPVSALNGSPPPAPSGSTGSSGTPATQPVTVLSQTYRVMLYGAGQQPYITEVYANNDVAAQNTQSPQDPQGGFLSVAIYNPFSTAISLKNWQWATVNRGAGLSSLTVNPLPQGSTQAPQSISDLSSFLPSSLNNSIPAHSRILFVSNTNMPPGITSSSDSSVVATVVLPSLNASFANELVLIRPHSADGRLTSSTDPANTFNENVQGAGASATQNLSDFVPVDSYDFTGLNASAMPDDSDSTEWHYARPSDTASHNWYFVYPYTYNADTTKNTVGTAPPSSTNPTSRLFATLVTSGSSRYTGTPSPLPLGGPLTAPADPKFATNSADPNSGTQGLGFPIQVNNTDFGGPKESTAVGQFPFGGFARNGDIMQTTFIGAYRIDVININSDNSVTTTTVEYNPITMDAAFADDEINTDNGAENVGRFCPMSPADCSGLYDDYSSHLAATTTTSPYHFSTRLYDFLTVNGPADDYLSTQNAGSQTAGPRPYGIANVRPRYINAYPTLPNNPVTTEDNAPIDGLININTASWRVLATLNMANNAADNETLAKDIVYYRDVDDQSNPAVKTPHGPFKSILELNAVPYFRTTLASTALNGFSGSTPSSYGPKGEDRGPSDGDLAPFVANANDGVPGDFEKQFLAFNRISNLVTLRSDSFTTYILVQGWRNAGTANPELVVQRRAAFISDRSGVIPSNKVLNITNVPVGN